jgi:hypothetical protein
MPVVWYDRGVLWSCIPTHVAIIIENPLKADIHQRGLHVRLVPIADITAAMELVRFVPEADLPAKQPIGQPVVRL